ncbi:hypothetical protein [Pseudotabrizicola sediminis]|nr:hypothetical protein [Pseudotabrizicola sediminis]
MPFAVGHAVQFQERNGLIGGVGTVNPIVLDLWIAIPSIDPLIG